jgi:hypothetical protein
VAAAVPAVVVAAAEWVAPPVVEAVAAAVSLVAVCGTR